jgi:hypothetical protein
MFNFTLGNEIGRNNLQYYVFLLIIENLAMLHFVLVKSKLKYASVPWISVTITDSNLSSYKNAALYCSRFFQGAQYRYDNMLDKINLQIQHTRRHGTDALLLINSTKALNVALDSRNSLYSCSCSEHKSV